MAALKDGGKYRIIVNRSFPSPHNHAVNISVSKNTYVGKQFELKLPTIDNICQLSSQPCRQKCKNFQSRLG
jgi:hypothetical protein